MTEEGESCIPGPTCGATRWLLDGVLCSNEYDRGLCPAWVQEKERRCVAKCEMPLPLQACSGACVRRCPVSEARTPGSRACAVSSSGDTASHAASVLGEEVHYRERRARSYASLALAVGEGSRPVAAFLEATDALAALRVRAVGGGAPYAPVGLFLARRMAGCELQYAAERAGDAGILALRLLSEPRLVGCLLYASLGRGGRYPVGLWAAGREAVAEACVLQLDGDVAGLRLEGTENIVMTD